MAHRSQDPTATRHGSRPAAGAAQRLRSEVATVLRAAAAASAGVCAREGGR